MHKLVSLIILLCTVAVSACSLHTDSGEVAARAAQTYYEYLLQGRYAAYVAGMYLPDTIPDSYRKQLEDNAQMFIRQQQTEHGGIKEVRWVSHVVDTAAHAANVFMTLRYGDGTHEEVVVPMVECHGIWYMR